jgi:murein DD-endopeptidase MepM/ murein hydrolase activator NlpD
LPFYKAYLASKKVVNKFYVPQKSRHRLIHPFSRRYLSHFIVILIAAFTVGANLNANEAKREDLGETSILASLVTNEDLGNIAEEGPITTPNKVTHYVTQAGVSLTPQTGFEEETEIGPQTIIGGSVIVKPNQAPQGAEIVLRNEIIYHIVQEGETISNIAQKYGISVNTILWENNLSGYSIIRPGDKLTILPFSGIKHKVAKGETLGKIAKKYSVDPEDVLEANKLVSATDIKVGQSLLIPGGKKIYAAPTYTVRNLTTDMTPAKVVSSGKMTWPTSCRHISQYFGWRHSGLDIACGYGVPIYAANSGRVIKAQGGYNGGYGNITIIDHGNGTQTLYGHQSKIYVSIGETVTKGQVIGAMGSTGRSTGPHIHFEVRSGGVRRNPLSYIK